MSEVQEIAGRLSEAQRVYLDAVARYPGCYEPRHGTTANWALRHGYTQTMIRRPTGEIEPWQKGEFSPDIEVLGQTLTPLGEAVRAHLQAIQTERK